MVSTPAQSAIENVYDTHKERIVQEMGKVRDALRAAGYKCDEPSDISCDSYEWAMIVEGNGIRGGVIDVRFELTESMEYDGEMEDGINFGWNVSHEQGYVIGGFQPFNYTPDCWIHATNPDAVKARFELAMQCDPQSMVTLIADWVRDNPDV